MSESAENMWLSLSVSKIEARSNCAGDTRCTENYGNGEQRSEVRNEVGERFGSSECDDNELVVGVNGHETSGISLCRSKGKDHFSVSMTDVCSNSAFESCLPDFEEHCSIRRLQKTAVVCFACQLGARIHCIIVVLWAVCRSRKLFIEADQLKI